jgi:hypothetical protein
MSPNLVGGEMASLSTLPLSAAEKDRKFAMLASTWDVEDLRFVPGAAGRGPKVINLANILKYDALPFAQAISMVLEIGSRSMGTPVEIEYSLNLDEPGEKPALYILQLKPLIHLEAKVKVEVPEVVSKDSFIYSEKSMGNGRDQRLTDIVWVDPDLFDRSKTNEMSSEIGMLDAELKAQGRQYVLVGPGRWGTRDHWLGIPVTFSQISRAKIIAEVDLKDFVVDSSLGSHFFHNLTTMDIGYLKVSARGRDFIDWSWLKSLKPAMVTDHCRWTRLDRPMDVRMDGRNSRASILKCVSDSSEQSMTSRHISVDLIDG